MALECSKLYHCFHKNLNCKFNVINVIGKGAYGIVCAGIATTPESLLSPVPVAAKYIRHDPQPAEELAFLGNLSHPNLIKYFGTAEECDDFGLGTLVIISELCTGSSLNNLIMNHEIHLPLSAKARLAKDVLSGLVYLHSHSICHGDIKPDNIFLSECSPNATAKIGDLDDAVQIENSKDPLHQNAQFAMKGTSAYTSPELARICLGDNLTLNCKADVWSFGCVVIQMIQRGNFVLKKESGEEFDPFQAGISFSRTTFFTKVLSFIKDGGRPTVSAKSTKRFNSLINDTFVYDVMERLSSKDLYAKYKGLLSRKTVSGSSCIKGSRRETLEPMSSKLYRRKRAYQGKQVDMQKVMKTTELLLTKEN